MSKKLFLILAALLILIQVFFVNPVHAYPEMPSYVHTDIVWAEKSDYIIGIDKNTGAIYNFTNKRANGNANTIHAHPGAALQVAIHHGQLNSLTTDGCSGQGYWNPTQAGAACSYPNPATGHKTPAPGSDYHIICDGVQNDNCSTVENSLEQTYFRMMNFDYGPNYIGPYNEQDLMYMKQKATLKDSYVQIDYSLKNNGIARPHSLIEMPTYYFEPNYRTYSYLAGSTMKTDTFPRVRVLDNALSDNTGNFITLEDSSKPNSAITIAWYYDESFASSLWQSFTNKLYISAAPFQNRDYVKMRIVNGFFPTSKEVGLKYVVIPYRYDAVISTEYGNLQVKDFVSKLSYKEEFVTKQLNSGAEYIAPSYQKGNILVTQQSNEFAIGLKANTNYAAKQSNGLVFFSNRKIKRIEFDYETNFDGANVYAAIDVPDNPFYYKFTKSGASTGQKVSIEVPYVDWVAFGLYSDKSFSYSYQDYEWLFRVKNLKFYYYDDGFGEPTSPECELRSSGDFDCNNQINLIDYQIFITEYMSSLRTGSSTLRSDINGNGKVDLVDFNLWREGYVRQF